MKRERWKGFNRYVKEFHKRKERIHREKIDRIQREKINLLKINDVEGYLRMVQVCLFSYLLEMDTWLKCLICNAIFNGTLGCKIRSCKATA